MTKPIIYLSGTGSSHSVSDRLHWAKVVGCTHFCFTFANVHPEGLYFRKDVREFHDGFLKLGHHVMMDSSGYSFHRLVNASFGIVSARKRRNYSQLSSWQAAMKSYIRFCKEHGGSWDFYMNFDYTKNCEKVFAIQKLIEKEGLHPTPVYHGDDSTDWLKRYLDLGYKRIGIGRPAVRGYRGLRFHLDIVFRILEKYPGVKTHGFAMTAPTVIHHYPWTTVDSSSWAYVSNYGCIFQWDVVRGTVSQTHISSKRVLSKSSRSSLHTMTGIQKEELRRQIAEQGFDLEKMRSSALLREQYNAKVYIQYCNQGVFPQEGVRWQRLL